ncbi:hypothetical protein GV794_02095 [Nocardia cyriacigeorgica]|uniref:C2H2-type domain-containing protein n=1 Tax=Nocardia cyriacigeorgica TaxID=135487 RepID=A0ABX0CD14_9NOCA|nr:hypothetical protein [Nocardia cyriacigeorgica]NEW42752.1 hypothetical protein [Nocardia cyriacigeorgica]NEW53953.1 hypothetical protein [Nocardia cyriacigeorgica]NEW54458.1 hypothetical protein [Nocardia cyriacigeorgica]
MARTPFTITRVPKPRRVAAASEPAGRTTPSAASVCPDCGALIADAGLHRAHHDRTDRWAARVSEVLRTVVAALRIHTDLPADENTMPTSEGGRHA